MIDVAEKSGFAGRTGFDLPPKRKTCTNTSNPTVAISPAQNHALAQRGCVWSN